MPQKQELKLTLSIDSDVEKAVQAYGEVYICSVLPDFRDGMIDAYERWKQKHELMNEEKQAAASNYWYSVLRKIVLSENQHAMSLTTKQRRFIDEYLKDYNATQAAIRAGYSEKTAAVIGHENLRKPNIAEEIDRHVEAEAVGGRERLKLLAFHARNMDEGHISLKAIELLGKLAGDYIDRHEHKGQLDIVLDWGDGDNG